LLPEDTLDFLMDRLSYYGEAQLSVGFLSFCRSHLSVICACVRFARRILGKLPAVDYFQFKSDSISSSIVILPSFSELTIKIQSKIKLYGRFAAQMMRETERRRTIDVRENFSQAF
jgi:hypothetical protein